MLTGLGPIEEPLLIMLMLYAMYLAGKFKEGSLKR